jgi:hypothetical protein
VDFGLWIDLGSAQHARPGPEQSMVVNGLKDGVDYFLILNKEALCCRRKRPGERIGFAPNSLLRPKRRNKFPACAK